MKLIDAEDMRQRVELGDLFIYLSLLLFQYRKKELKCLGNGMKAD